MSSGTTHFCHNSCYKREVNGSMTQPSIRGSSFSSAHADLNRLLEEGRVTQEELAVELNVADIELLKQTVSLAGWFPIDSYGRILNLLARLESGGDELSYFMKRGEDTAKRLHDAGTVPQFEADVELWGQQVGNLMVSLAGAIFNFSSWAIRNTHWDMDGAAKHCEFIIDVTDAEEIPEPVRYTIQGFATYMMCVGTKDFTCAVSSRRPTPDHIQFTTRL